MQINKVQNLQFKKISTASGKAHDETRENCFALWQDVWSKTFIELNVTKRLTSDDFLDRDLLGLFNGNDESNPVAFMLMKSFNSRSNSHLAHSYFQNYPSEVLTFIQNLKSQAHIISYMTIHPDWRKQNTDVSLSEIVMGLCVLNFIQGPAEHMLGYFRNNRKTNDIFYRHGGKPLMLKSEAYNVEVDFGQLAKSEAHMSTNVECANYTRHFWQQQFKQESTNLITRRENDTDAEY